MSHDALRTRIEGWPADTGARRIILSLLDELADTETEKIERGTEILRLRSALDEANEILVNEGYPPFRLTG